ncbi:hypothetical protein [Streptomyces sp. NPDC056634]
MTQELPFRETVTVTAVGDGQCTRLADMPERSMVAAGTVVVRTDSATT